MQRADGFDLRRRTADLSADRGAGEGTARAGPDRLHLHERHVHAQENARVAGLADCRAGRNSSKKKSTALLGGGFDQRKRCGRNSQGTERSGKANDWSDQMDVLERAPRRAWNARTI